MSIGGAGNYGFLFNSTTGNNNAGLANALFGGKNTMLSDYSMIKSGAYKKLLTAYYKSQDSEAAKTKNTKTSKTSDVSDSKKTSAKDKTKTETKEEDVNLTAKSAAEKLKTSAQALDSKSLYLSTGKDEKGNAVYKRDDIASAVKTFAADYNSALEAAGKSDSSSVKSRASSLVSATASNANLLKDIGITIGTDNKLIVDEEKLKGASVSKMTALFRGTGSYANRAASSASAISRAAYNAANAKSSYSQSGSYNASGVSSLLDQYF